MQFGAEVVLMSVMMMMSIIPVQEIWITVMEELIMKVLGQVKRRLKMLLSLRNFSLALYNLIIFPKKLLMWTGNF